MKSEKIQYQLTSDQKLVETVLSHTTRFCGKVFAVETLSVRLPDGRTAGREIVRHHGGVAIVALTDRGDVVMIRQFRVAIGKVLCEIPAGKLEGGEDPFECAKRELKEETGMVAEEWRPLGKIYPTPGYVDEALYLYLARRLTRGEQHLDPGEFLVVEEISFDLMVKEAAEGRLEDGKSCVALLRAKALLLAERSQDG
jgi:ADP-ribose pyrophosphatase